MPPFWKKIERLGVENFPYWLEDDDVCYYARDYISEGGYDASEANGLIHNFKKNPDRRGRPEWYYKERAIERFAKELNTINNLSEFAVTCIPGSAARDDPQYDSRLEDTLSQLHRLNPSITIEYPLVVRQSMRASHMGGTRDPETFYTNLRWAGMSNNVADVVLIDDVITSGAHFKACKRKIIENVTDAHVIGVFWARSVRSSPF